MHSKKPWPVKVAAFNFALWWVVYPFPLRGLPLAGAEFFIRNCPSERGTSTKCGGGSSAGGVEPVDESHPSVLRTPPLPGEELQHLS